MRLTRILAVLSLVAVCGACAPMSDAHLFNVAVQAVKAHPKFPPQATIGAVKDAEFYVGKNAACVYVPYEVADPGGARRLDTFTVWLKRICVRWEIDRCDHTP